MKNLINCTALIFILLFSTTSTFASFVDNGDGTVTDTSTGLMWELKTNDGGERDWNNTYNWQEALSYCENLDHATHTDWRLPNRVELRSIIDYTEYDPAINENIFPNTQSQHYWSSTTYINPEIGSHTSNAYQILFLNGFSHASSKSDKKYVRAVRDAQEVMPGKWIITGTVSQIDNTTLEGILVCFWHSGASNCSATTDAGGRYTIGDPERLQDGLYTVYPQAAGYVFDPPSRQVRLKGDHAFNVNFIAYQQGAALTVDIDSPLANASLTQDEILGVEADVNGASGSDLYVFAKLTEDQGSVVAKFDADSVDENGKRVASLPLSGISPGDYTLEVIAEYESNGELSRSSAERKITVLQGLAGLLPQPSVEVKILGEHIDGAVPQVWESNTLGLEFTFEYTDPVVNYDESNPDRVFIVDELTDKRYEGFKRGSLGGTRSFRATIPANEIGLGLRPVKWEVLPPPDSGYAPVYGKQLVEAVVPQPLLAKDLTDAIPPLVFTGQEIVFRIQLTESDGTLFGAPEIAGIKATVEYKNIETLPSGYKVADLPVQPLAFGLVDAGQAIYEARYQPITPGIMTHEIFCEFETPGYIKPSSITYSLKVENDQRVANLLTAYRDSSLTCLNHVKELGTRTSKSGDYFIKTRDENIKKRFSLLIDATLDWLAAGRKYNELNTPKDKLMEYFNIGGSKKKANEAIRKFLSQDLYFSKEGWKLFKEELYKKLDLSGPAYIGNVVASKIYDVSVDQLRDELAELMAQREPFYGQSGNGQIHEKWLGRANRFSNAIWTDSRSAIDGLPVHYEKELAEAIATRLAFYQMADQSLVEICSAQVDKINSIYMGMKDQDESVFRKINAFLLGKVMPILADCIAPKGGKQLYNAGYKTVQAAFAAHKSNVSAEMAQLAEISFNESLFKGVTNLAQNGSYVFAEVENLANVPLCKADVEVLGERKDVMKIFGVPDLVFRRYFSVKITNTGDTTAVFHPYMSYYMVLHMLYTARSEMVVCRDFHDGNGNLVSQLMLAPGESRTLEFDIFRKGYVQLPELDMEPLDDSYISFKVLALPVNDNPSSGLTYAGHAFHRFEENYTPVYVDPFRSNYGVKTAVGSKTRAADSEEMDMPLSVSVFRDPQSADVIVLYSINNPFSEPVVFTLTQPLPDGVSAVLDEGETTAEGIRYTSMIQGGEYDIFSWRTSFSGSDDFAIPASSLQFRAPTTGTQANLDFQLQEEPAAALVPLSVSPNYEYQWKLGETHRISLGVESWYGDDKALTLEVSVTDLDGAVRTWNFNENASPGENTFPLDIPVPSDLAAGLAGLKIAVTPADGPRIDAVDLSVILVADSDNDGLPDDWEKENGLVVGIDDSGLDKDGDGLSNEREYELGTKANEADTDGDGVSDGQEVDTRGTDPLLTDTDGGGLEDGAEIRAGSNPLEETDDPLSVTIRLANEIVAGDAALVLWTPSNPFAQNVSYRFSVGTTEGGDDAINWTDMGVATDFSLDTSLLTAIGTYYANVRMLQGGRQVSEASQSFSLSDEPGDSSPLAFGKRFVAKSEAEVKPNEPVTVVFTIDNTGSDVAAENIAFTDNIGQNAWIAEPSNASTNCSQGDLIAEAGTHTITLAGGSLPAGQTCQVRVDIVVDSAGRYVNTTEPLSSSLGESDAASASLQIGNNEIPALGPAGYLFLAALVSLGSVFCLRRRNTRFVKTLKK